MTQLFGVLLALICVLFSALPVVAHHSFEAEFDGSKLLTFTGVLTDFEELNPEAKIPRTPEGNDERFFDEQEYQRMRKQYP